jgi:hypothetical protein
VSLPTKKEIKLWPKDNQVQINRRRDALTRLQSIKDAKKALKNHYSNGIETFDADTLDKLYEAENKVQQRFIEISIKIKNADKSDEKFSYYKEALKAVKKEKSEIKHSIKVMEYKYSVYSRAVKPYLDAQRILKQAELYADVSKYTF